MGVYIKYHSFDFRKPQMVQEFQIAPNSMLKIDFYLIVKGIKNSGFLSFLLNLNPGFNIYVGGFKIYDFNLQGWNDEQWHAYSLTMNKTEVQRHWKEAGDKYLLITIKVIRFVFFIFPFLPCPGLVGQWPERSCSAGQS